MHIKWMNDIEELKAIVGSDKMCIRDRYGEAVQVTGRESTVQLPPTVLTYIIIPLLKSIVITQQPGRPSFSAHPTVPKDIFTA